MLSIQGLSHRYAGAPPIEFPDFEAPQGTVVRVAGPSGSGKSTLLALVAGLLPVQRGRLRVCDTELADLGERARDVWRGTTLGFIPQRLHLSAGLTVDDNLALPFVAAALPVDHGRIAAVLQRLGLTTLRARRPGQLSVGQAQRVAIARALLRSPRLIVADEPSAHLDDGHTHEMLGLLAEVAAEQGATLVVASHDQRVATAFPQSSTLSLQAMGSGTP